MVKDYILAALGKHYSVTEEKGIPYEKLDKSGMHFRISSYEVPGLGHLCAMEMTAMLGLMKMESVVLTAEAKDLPLFNIDTVRAAGRHTLLVEFYDTMVSPLAPDQESLFRAAADRFASLPSYETGPRWYDSIRYDFSLGKTGKETRKQGEAIIRAYMEAYLEAARRAPDTDPEVKKAKTRAYADQLLAQGGPAVDQFRKLFGEEVTRDFFTTCMFRS